MRTDSHSSFATTPLHKNDHVLTKQGPIKRDQSPIPAFMKMHILEKGPGKRASRKHKQLLSTPSYCPSHLKSSEAPDGGIHQNAVFGNDDRYVYHDTSFPWRTIGRVDDPRTNGTTRIGTGTMVGPRHVLTANHLIDWGPDGESPYTIRFSPAYDEEVNPRSDESPVGVNPEFGSAYGIGIYSILEWNQYTDRQLLTSVDYVVVVLDRYIGKQTGWLGTREYDEDWTGEPGLHTCGYPGGPIGNPPGEPLGCKVPVYTSGPGMIDRYIEFGPNGWDSYYLEHQMDCTDGQSGGPIFGFLKDSGLQVIAVQSVGYEGPSRIPNAAGGGAGIPGLVAAAIEAYP